MSELLIFSVNNDRTNYALRLIFEQMLGWEIHFEESKEAFNSWQGPSLIYLPEKPENCEAPFIQASNLLRESDVKEQSLAPFHYENTLALFPQDSPSSLLPFDVFSATFYLVTRYEEYGQAEKTDENGRFLPEHSILYHMNCLGQPVINRYANILRDKLLAYYPELDNNQVPFRPLSTIDVDTAFAHKGRKPFKFMGSLAQAFFSGEWAKVKDKLEVSSNQKRDPFDSFSYINRKHDEFKTELIYFFLLSKGSKRDRNLPPDNKEYQRLIRSLAKNYKTGLHPSYISHQKYSRLKEEAAWYRKITNQHPFRSRQHFLKFTLPETYRNLIHCGIKEDYSMGYPSQPGFRAGIAWPFYFYDLYSEQTTSLKVFPVAYMDGTLKEYLSLSPEEARVKIDELIESLGKTGGYFISIWHNHTVSNYYDWKNWQKVFEHSLKRASGKTYEKKPA